MIDSSKIAMIDDVFASYQMNQEEEVFQQKLSTILNGFATDKRFEIHIVECQEIRKEPFFGMRVFPNKEYADSMMKDFCKKSFTLRELIERWRHIKSWDIELDSRIFDRSIINFNSKELTAMLLHEIGHVIYSDKITEVFYRAYKEAYIRSKIEEKAQFRVMYKLYMIPLFFACGFRSWKVDSEDLREEIFADTSVKKLGYGDQLISAYQKIIRAYGNPQNWKSQQDVISNSIQSCNMNIIDLEKRKQHLKDELYYIGTRNRGFWIRNVISDIFKSLGIYKKDRYDGNIVMEALREDEYTGKDFLDSYTLLYQLKPLNMVRNQLRIAKETATPTYYALEGFSKKPNLKKLKVPSQLDVDTLFVEVDRIQSHIDRKYVLDLIYCQEEKIIEFLELIDGDPILKEKHTTKMQGMLKELAEMRKNVLAKRSFDRQYKVFVKYPVGYEG